MVMEEQRTYLTLCISERIYLTRIASNFKIIGVFSNSETWEIYEVDEMCQKIEDVIAITKGRELKYTSV